MYRSARILTSRTLPPRSQMNFVAFFRMFIATAGCEHFVIIISSYRGILYDLIIHSQSLLKSRKVEKLHTVINHFLNGGY